MIDRRTLVARNIRRNPKHFLFTSVGIVLGVASFVFFVALGSGVRSHVLERVFVSDQLEVTPHRIDVGAFRAEGSLFRRGTGLDDGTVAEIAALDGVVGVYPKQEVAFPAYAYGGATLVGRTFWTELVSDGIPPDLVIQDPTTEQSELFVDWGTADRACDEDGTCEPGATCVEGVCVPNPCTPDDEVWATADRDAANQAVARIRRVPGLRGERPEVRDLGGAVPPDGRFRVVLPAEHRAAAQRALRDSHADGAAVETADGMCVETPSYCQPQRRRCEMPVPALLSYTLLELYNGSIHSALSGTAGALRGLPQMNEDVLVGFEFDVVAGRGYLGDSRAVAEGEQVPLDLHFRVVGFSTLAIAVGATVPLGYVKRWNRAYNGDRAADQYSSILVRTATTEDLHRVAHAATNELGLDLDPKYEAAQRASLLITIITAVMALLSLLIVGLAALNIMHTLLMVVAERRQEIGVMRAVGASRRDVYALVVGESLAICMVGVVVAFMAAAGAMALVDAAFDRVTPDFPFKPDTLFSAPLALWTGAAVIGVVSCLLGAWLPAARAARFDPAKTMGGY